MTEIAELPDEQRVEQSEPEGWPVPTAEVMRTIGTLPALGWADADAA